MSQTASTKYGDKKGHLVELLKNQSNALGNILSMEGFSLITDDERNKLVELQSETDTICRKLQNNEFEIAVVGMEKAGKSSFCNALMENMLLPTKQARCTFTSTRVEYGNESRGEVIFYTESEFNALLQDKLTTLNIPNANTYTLRSLSSSEFERLYDENASPEIKTAYGSSLVIEVRQTIDNKNSILRCLGTADRVFSGDVLNSDEFKKYIESPGYAMAVKNVIIKSAALGAMKNAVVYDVPGFNSPTAEHKRQTRERMQQADAIIVVASASQPSLLEEQLKVFREQDADGVKFADKLFVYANKADTSHLADSVDVTYDEWGAKYGILSDKGRFFFGSSNAQLQAMGLLDDGIDYMGSMERALAQLPTEYDKVRLGSSEDNGYGVLAIRESLEEYNRTTRLEVLEQRIGRLRQTLREIADDLRDRTPDVSGTRVSEQYFGEVMMFVREFGKKLEEILNNYRAELLQSIHTNKQLSQKLIAYIEENISPEAHQGLIADELEKAKKDVDITRPNADAQINQAYIENWVRKAVFGELYAQGFAKSTAGVMTSELYDEIVDSVLDRCMEAMDVPKASKHYDALKDDLKDHLKKYGELDIEAAKDYFQSLIDRYSRDIFELLIGQRYDVERYERFRQDMPLFLSMAIYYDPDTDPMDTPPIDKLTGSPRDSLFCYQMLCHDYTFDRVNTQQANADSKKLQAKHEIEEYMTSHNMSPKAKHIPELIQSIVDIDPDNAAEIVAGFVDEACEDESESHLARLQSVRHSMTDFLSQQTTPTVDLRSFDISDGASFKAAYAKCFNLNRTEEALKADLNEDIEILRHVLLYCFIRALDPEKPFVTRVVNMINGVKKHLTSAESEPYFAPRIRLIRSDAFQDIEEQELELERNRAFRKSIDEILDSVFEDGEVDQA